MRSNRPSEFDTETEVTQSLAATFATACDQALKSGLGKTVSTVAFYETRSVVHLNALPLVISVVLEPEGNVGQVLQLAEDLFHAIEPLRQQIQRVESQFGSQ